MHAVQAVTCARRLPMWVVVCTRRPEGKHRWTGEARRDQNHHSRSRWPDHHPRRPHAQTRSLLCCPRCHMNSRHPHLHHETPNGCFRTPQRFGSYLDRQSRSQSRILIQSRNPRFQHVRPAHPLAVRSCCPVRSSKSCTDHQGQSQQKAWPHCRYWGGHCFGSRH